mmetsp:Transcript_11562/g.24506  ORF Transcript_11562/g.24506 Transcript_11562/m.24506 type:complete len:205 (+) Transcript_11562:1439-2053(+)
MEFPGFAARQHPLHKVLVNRLHPLVRSFRDLCRGRDHFLSMCLGLCNLGSGEGDGGLAVQAATSTPQIRLVLVASFLQAPAKAHVLQDLFDGSASLGASSDTLIIAVHVRQNHTIQNRTYPCNSGTVAAKYICQLLAIVAGFRHHHGHVIACILQCLQVVKLGHRQLYFAVAIELYLLCRNFHAAEHCIDFGLHFEINYPRFPS